jgi:hypothetical protein
MLEVLGFVQAVLYPVAQLPTVLANGVALYNNP